MSTTLEMWTSPSVQRAADPEAPVTQDNALMYAVSCGCREILFCLVDLITPATLIECQIICRTAIGIGRKNIGCCDRNALFYYSPTQHKINSRNSWGNDQTAIFIPFREHFYYLINHRFLPSSLYRYFLSPFWSASLRRVGESDMYLERVDILQHWRLFSATFFCGLVVWTLWGFPRISGFACFMTGDGRVPDPRLSHSSGLVIHPGTFPPLSSHPKWHPRTSLK